MRIVPGWGRLLGGGQDRDGPLAAEGKLLGGHMPAGWKWGRGRPTNRSKASRDEAADYLCLRQALCGAPLGVGAGRGVGAHPGDDDPPQGVVGLAVAAGVEAVAGALA